MGKGEKQATTTFRFENQSRERILGGSSKYVGRLLSLCRLLWPYEDEGDVSSG